MMKYSFYVFLGVTAAFQVHPLAKSAGRLSSTSLRFYPEEFERAVECAGTFGVCSVDELLKLADELDEYQGCFFEKSEANRDKESIDRSDVADVLRLQSELLLRQQYLKNANIFNDDVQKNRLQKEREKLLELMATLGTD